MHQVIPIILAETKLDIQDDNQFFIDHPGTMPTTTAHGKELRKLLGALAYIKCSSKIQPSVKVVFDAAIKVVLQPLKQQRERHRRRVLYYDC